MPWWFAALIALFGAGIAYAQSRTAHQRVVLDLFDRRFKVFEETERVISRVRGAAPRFPGSSACMTANGSRSASLTELRDSR
jgi:hypothetical protein